MTTGTKRRVALFVESHISSGLSGSRGYFWLCLRRDRGGAHVLPDSERVESLHTHPGQPSPEEYNMTTGTKRMVALFVERSYQQWVVRDPRATSGYCLPSKTHGGSANRFTRRQRRSWSQSLVITRPYLAYPSKPKMKREVRYERRRDSTCRGSRAEDSLEEVGTVPERAPVGHGARGLQRKW